MVDPIAVASLVVSSVTAMGAMYISFATLKHTAKPTIGVAWQRSTRSALHTAHDHYFIFDVVNMGRWYAKPPAREVVVEFVCPAIFSKVQLLRGGISGELEDHGESHSSPGPDMILRSRPFALHAGEQRKYALVVKWTMLNMTGNSNVTVKATSADGATIFKVFPFLIES